MGLFGKKTDMLVSLAVRIRELEIRVEALEKGTETEEQEAERKEEQRMMEGMESIFSYSWPPKKGGNE